MMSDAQRGAVFNRPVLPEKKEKSVMKKMTALLLALLLMIPMTAGAESPVFDLLTRLMAGRTFTLTVSAEGEGELADIAAGYGTVTCTLRREKDEILLDAACDGDAFLKAWATETGVRFETNLLESGVFESDWAALVPDVTAGEDEISIRMNGPDHELITFSVKVSGTELTDCEVEVHIGFITGPGNVHSLWDGITCRDGEAGREFYFTFSEEEYAIEGEGTAAAETDEDGTTTITRVEECTVTHNEEEIGTIIFRSTLAFR